jgi:hypothetical protein
VEDGCGSPRSAEFGSPSFPAQEAFGDCLERFIDTLSAVPNPWLSAAIPMNPGSRLALWQGQSLLSNHQALLINRLLYDTVPNFDTCLAHGGTPLPLT